MKSPLPKSTTPTDPKKPSSSSNPTPAAVIGAFNFRESPSIKSSCEHKEYIRRFNGEILSSYGDAGPAASWPNRKRLQGLGNQEHSIQPPPRPPEKATIIPNLGKKISRTDRGRIKAKPTEREKVRREWKEGACPEEDPHGNNPHQRPWMKIWILNTAIIIPTKRRQNRGLIHRPQQVKEVKDRGGRRNFNARPPDSNPEMANTRWKGFNANSSRHHYRQVRRRVKERKRKEKQRHNQQPTQEALKTKKAAKSRTKRKARPYLKKSIRDTHPHSSPVPHKRMKHSSNSTRKNSLATVNLTNLLPPHPQMAMENNPMQLRGERSHLVLNVKPRVTGARGSGMAMLLGKWITDTNINLQKAKNTAASKWRAYGEVQATKEADNLYVYSFQNTTKRDAVYDARPWNLGNTLIALRKWDGEQKAEPSDIPTVTLWVQMHDLPQSLKDEEAIQAVAEYIFPHYYGIDQSNFEFRGWLKFIRAKVEVELDKPSPIGFEYPQGEKSIWVSFKYERIMDLCYFYGKLGHLIQNCLQREDHRRRGLCTDPSEVYTPALKAGHNSPANTPPASFREKFERSRQLAIAGARTHRLRGSRGESSLMSLVGRTGQGSASCPPGFAALTTEVPQQLEGPVWIQRETNRSPTAAHPTGFMEEEMEAVTLALQRSLDLTRRGTSADQEAGLKEMGQTLTLASPLYSQLSQIPAQLGETYLQAHTVHKENPTEESYHQSQAQLAPPLNPMFEALNQAQTEPLPQTLFTTATVISTSAGGGSKSRPEKKRNRIPETHPPFHSPNSLPLLIFNRRLFLFPQVEVGKLTRGGETQ